MNTCEICGGKLKQDGSCPACQGKSKQNKKKLMLAVIGAVAAVAVLVCVFLLGRMSKPTEEKTQQTQMESESVPKFVPKDYDITGTCGEDAQWGYQEETGALTIIGLGGMEDYEVRTQEDGSAFSTAPWADLDIVEVKVYGLESIGTYAFAYCKSLKEIELPDSIAAIGEGAFLDCTKLDKIRYGGTREQWSVLELSDIHVDIQFPSGEIEEAEPIPEFVPEDYDRFGYCGKSVQWGYEETDGKLTIIGTGDMEDYASGNAVPWRDLEILMVKIDGVKTIGEYAFAGTGLKSAIIGNSVTEIGGYAFSRCGALMSVLIGNRVETIGEYAFSKCGFLEITIPDSVQTIGDCAFSGCGGLSAIEADNGAYVDVDGVLFTKDKKTLVQYPKGKTQTSYTIPDGVQNIGDYAFSGCDGLTSITIPDGVQTIGDNAFYNCGGLTSITIPDGVQTIGDDAFFDCDGLTSITIPDSVQTIGDCAFGPVSITVAGDEEPMGGGPADLPDVQNLYVNYAGSKEQWDSISATDYAGNSRITIHYNS